jgi:FMN-dependent NADH-azoreductase
MKLLHIDSGILGEHSVSRRLTAAVVAQWKADVPGLDVTYRDLAAEPLDHLSGAVVASGFADGAAALEEFLASDVIVVGAPMYNFTIPSQLKAWIDRLAVQGKTFRYTENGPIGLVGGKTLIVVSTRGGFYGADTPMAGLDHQEAYLRTVFGFLGITDIRFLRAEGVAVSPDHKSAAIAAAEREIAESSTLFRLAA